MNILLENGLIREIESGADFSYVLNDSKHFASTEYKVLLNQGEKVFLKMMKILNNGKIQFFYLTNNCRPLASMIPTMDPEIFMTLASNLLKNILDVKNNGFLSCRNIDISFEHIYVDPASLKVYLIYLPANIHFYPDDSSFENELRTELFKIIDGTETLKNESTLQLKEDLSNGMLSFEQLVAKTKGGKTVMKESVPEVESAELKLKLVAMNAPDPFEFEVTSDEFVIGKKKEAVDQVISFNDKISRVHCRINCNGNEYTVTDLGSANGTYVNGTKLQANTSCPIKNGDMVKLANSTFKVVIR